MKKSFIIYSLSFFLFLISTVNPVQAQSVEKRTISPKKFERKMDRKQTIVLDVRTPEEFKAGHIPGAVNIDVKQQDFQQRIQSLDRSGRYLIYCKSGRRSETALKKMQQEGFRKVYHLQGGIENWKGKVE